MELITQKRSPGRPLGTKKGGAIRPLTEDELVRFFKATHANKKWRLMFNLALHFGLRSKELATLRLEDVDRENLQITIRSCKGGRIRTYTADELPAGIWRLVDGWLKQRRTHKQNPYVFPSRLDPTGAMSAIGTQCAFRNVCRRAGITGHSIHDLRHTCGQRLAKMNFSATRISRWLRQKSSQSAEVYITLEEDKELGRHAAEAMPIYS